MYMTICGQACAETRIIGEGNIISVPASSFMVCTKFRQGLNLIGTEMHALSCLRRSYSVLECFSIEYISGADL